MCYRGRFGRLIAVNSYACAVPVWLVGYADRFWQSLLIGLILGAIGSAFAAGTPCVTRFSPAHRRGLAMGVFGAGTSGAALNLFVAPWLIDTFGWRTVPRVYAVALLATAAIFALLALPAPGSESRQAFPRMREQLGILRDPRVWKYCQYCSLTFDGFTSLSLWMPQYFTGEYGIAIAMAAALAASFSLPAGALRALGGALSDRFGAHATTWWVLWLAWVALFILSYPQTRLTVETVHGPATFHLGVRLWLFVPLLFALGTPEHAGWKTVGFDRGGRPVAPRGSIGFRWPEAGSLDRAKWNLEQKTADGTDIELQLTGIGRHDEILDMAFPYFAVVVNEHFPRNDQGDVLVRKVPARKLATVLDLLCAHYGLDRGLGGDCAKSYQDNVPYTPAWQETITGTPAARAIEVVRGFASNAEKTHGRSMVIIGSGMNHWFHQDVTYRAVISMLMLCGTVGQSGGGWAHYAGQECIRPEVGWATLAFALDWVRPPRQMASTSFFYMHSDQWRYERVRIGDLLSPLAERDRHAGTIIDHNVRAQRMGWMPTAPQLNRNPLAVAREAMAAGGDPKQHVAEALKSGKLALASEDPGSPENYPRNLFVWRSNLLGSPGKGHEYFLKHFLGTQSGIQGKDLGAEGEQKPEEVKWHDPAPEGKLDLVVTSDFRMSTTALYSDIVLPTASWYEKSDLSTTDMHPFIHPFTPAVNPVYKSRSDWNTFRTTVLVQWSMWRCWMASGTPGVTRVVFSNNARSCFASIRRNSLPDWE